MSSRQKAVLVVGIGASAGGLAVLKAFVSSLKKTGRMSFIVVQHLSPEHESMLPELLGRETELPVVGAEDGDQIQCDTIFVIPPDAYIELDGNRLCVSTPKEPRGFRKAVDYLFTSLAEQCEERCAGIVFSGSGSDGTLGLRKIKAAGGLTLAQDPTTAQHSSMPLSAIDADAIDKIVPPDEMFPILLEYLDHPYQLKQESDDEATSLTVDLDEVEDILKTHEDFNLGQYKTPTVQRRIARRMSLTNTHGQNRYVDKLKNEAEERKRLIRDLLINVTDFFRDPEAFQVLEKNVLGEILDNLEDGEEFRIWVAGCASGEEAYSLAMILLEVMEKTEKNHPIRIFATDIDEHAVSIARKGVYPGGILDAIPGNYIDKYFSKLEELGQYRVKTEVRDIISFAAQDVVNDPPFGKMHLISCRNVLIYLNKNVQERVLNSFYFSLTLGGYLFLGTSESLGNKTDMFKTVSKKWRVYCKTQDRKKRYVLYDQVHAESSQEKRLSNYDPNRVKTKQKEGLLRSQQMRRALLDAFLPPSVIVDFEGKILYSHGNWKPYIEIRSGEPTHNLVQLIASPMRSRMRSALYKVQKSKQSISFRSVIKHEHKANLDKKLRVELAFLEDTEFADHGAIGVVFFEEGEQESFSQLTQDDDDHAKRNIEQELSETRDELQNTIEELETSSEELKASHEEALSTNEELQSANEELEASSEELRSLNEELSTVNAQLKEKIDLLQKANDDVENFFASTDIPTIFLNPSLEIQRYTPAAEQLLKMGPRDIGRHISDLGRDLIDESLEQECYQVLQNFQPIRTERSSFGGGWYIRQVSPYRTEDRRIDGVVIVFQDVTEIKNLSRRAMGREQQQAVVAKLGMLALSGAEPEVIMHQAVRQVAHTLDADFCKVLKYQPDQGNFLMVSGVGWNEGTVGKLTLSAGQDTQAGYTLVSQEPVIFQNIEGEKRFKAGELLTDHHITSGLSCLINHSEPVFGVLCVYSKEQRNFTDDDANFLLSIANMLSSALQMQFAQDALHEREQQFRSLANSIPQLAWMTDDSGYVNWYNQRWYDYTGKDFDSMKGWGWKTVHHPDHIDRVISKFNSCIEQQIEWEDEFPLRNGNGEYRWFLSRAKPIRNQQNQVVRWFGTNTDITDKLEQANALRESENKLRLAMETTKVGSFEYSLQEEATHWDPMIKRIWGVADYVQATQTIFWQGVHPDDVEEVENAINQSMTGDSLGRYQAVFRVVNIRNKQLYWVEATGQVIFENDTPTKMIGMIIDISERKLLEESLKKAVKELQHADQSKNEFLSILGHELRNPLAALSNSVEILADKNDDEPDLFRVMKHSVSTMAKLLDDLLDLNRVSQNKIQLDLRRIDLKRVLLNAIEMSRNISYQKKHEIVTFIPGPIYMNGDESRMEQVFCNLLVNACRYTPEGGSIDVEVDDDHQFIRVTIRDNGVGISAEYLEKIFDPFFQIKQHKKASSGLGIGLALSKKLVQLHGGRIEAYSDGPNKGSEFVVRLPSLDLKNFEIESVPVRKTPATIRPGLKVLVVEDNENLLATLPVLLESLGCSVETADTGQKGIEKTWTFQPDVLLVDIGLPDISGHDVARALRSNGYNGNIIAVSGYSHTEVREQSKKVGFNHHLAKPVTLAEISEVLQKLESR